MNTMEPTPTTADRQQKMEAEAVEHRQTIGKMEAEKERILYQISRNLVSEKDWENFDPSEYTVPFEEVLADLNQLKE